MNGLPGKIVAVHEALDDAGHAHAFGGALALAWCTEQARGTIDIDVNVFVDADEAADRRRGPSRRGHRRPTTRSSACGRDGQIRLWWDTTPVDVFLNTDRFHEQAAARVRWEDFGGHRLPFLACTDLAVFKAFFDRTKDWADLEAMAEVGSLDLDRVVGVLVRRLGADDHRIDRLRALDAIEPRD